MQWWQWQVNLSVCYVYKYYIYNIDSKVVWIYIVLHSTLWTIEIVHFDVLCLMLIIGRTFVSLSWVTLNKKREREGERASIKADKSKSNWNVVSCDSVTYHIIYRQSICIFIVLFHTLKVYCICVCACEVSLSSFPSSKINQSSSCLPEPSFERCASTSAAYINHILKLCLTLCLKMTINLILDNYVALSCSVLFRSVHFIPFSSYIQFSAWSDR